MLLPHDYMQPFTRCQIQRVPEASNLPHSRYHKPIPSPRAKMYSYPYPLNRLTRPVYSSDWACPSQENHAFLCIEGMTNIYAIGYTNYVEIVLPGISLRVLPVDEWLR